MHCSVRQSCRCRYPYVRVREKLPFPITENLTDVELLIGSNRPELALPGPPAKGNYAAKPAVHKKGDPKAA